MLGLQGSNGRSWQLPGLAQARRFAFNHRQGPRGDSRAERVGRKGFIDEVKSSLASAAIKVPAQRVPQSPDSVDNRKELSGRQPGEGEEKVKYLSLFVSILFSSF
jgi:hypothetical protein